MHEHSTSSWLGWGLLDCVVVLVLFAAAIGYAVALWAARNRGQWPTYRAVFWYVGLACAGAGYLYAVAADTFTAHMVSHLLVGMVAPLLLVMAAPITLALRALPVPSARSLTRVLRSRWFQVLVHPVVAGTLNMGGLWLLYTTDLYPLMHSSVLVHGLVHLHFLLAGYIFTASIIGVDPNPHPTSMRLRSSVLIFFLAAHSILAKWLYAHPPAGVSVDDARVGSQLMYYGGDVVDVTLVVLLFAGWYSATRPRKSVARPSSNRGIR